MNASSKTYELMKIPALIFLQVLTFTRHVTSSMFTILDSNLMYELSLPCFLFIETYCLIIGLGFKLINNDRDIIPKLAHGTATLIIRDARRTYFVCSNGTN